MEAVRRIDVIRRMSEQNRRGGPGRRRHARGGRRPEDRAGHTPLVFVVTRDAASREFWELQLIAWRFAVVPCDDAGSALEAVKALRPDVVVTDMREADHLRDYRLLGRHGRRTPIVAFEGTTDWIAVILRDIRRELRAIDLVDR